jgi:hypothetical protein
MIREIVKPAGKTYTLNLPDDMIGKTVEVIAFEIEKNADPVHGAINVADIKRRYSKYPVISHENYQFNRDAAHDHE